MPKVKKTRTIADKLNEFPLLLNSIIALKGKTNIEVCKTLGANSATWARKKKMPRTFNLEDLIEICTVLDCGFTISKDGIKTYEGR